MSGGNGKVASSGSGGMKRAGRNKFPLLKEKESREARESANHEREGLLARFVARARQHADAGVVDAREVDRG